MGDLGHLLVSLAPGLSGECMLSAARHREHRNLPRILSRGDGAFTSLPLMRVKPGRLPRRGTIVILETGMWPCPPALQRRHWRVTGPMLVSRPRPPYSCSREHGGSLLFAGDDHIHGRLGVRLVTEHAHLRTARGARLVYHVGEVGAFTEAPRGSEKGDGMITPGSILTSRSR